MVKKQIFELPDLVIKSKNYQDSLSIFIRNKEIEFRVNIDGTGNVFKIERKVLEELLRWNYLYGQMIF